MGKTVLKSGLMLLMVILLTGLSSNAANAQEYKYRTQDQQYYMKFVKAGDSWAVYTAQSGGQWVAASMLYADNKTGYYKFKSNRTGNITVCKVNQSNVANLTVTRPDGSGATKYTYYPY